MVLLGVYVFVFSETGIFERKNLQKKIYLSSEQIQKLQIINRDLELRIEQYSKGNFPLSDILDSGYVPVGSLTIFLENSQPSSFKETKEKIIDIDMDSGKPDIFDTESLRIMWIVFSIFIMLAAFSRIYFKDDPGNNSDEYNPYT